MAKPLDRRHTDTRERLFEIALDLFAEHGVNGTSIRDIVGKAGISTAAFYNHFKSKNELLEEIYRFHMAKRNLPEADALGDLGSTLAKIGPAGVIEGLTQGFRESLENPLLEKLARVILMEQHTNPVAAGIVHDERGKLVSFMEELLAAMQTKGYLEGRNARLLGRMIAYLYLGFFGDNEYYRNIKGESADRIIERQNETMREFITELIGG